MTLDSALLAILACPEDKGPLYYIESESVLYNPRLKRTYEVRDGIPVMLVEEATTLDRGRAATGSRRWCEDQQIAPDVRRDELAIVSRRDVEMTNALRSAPVSRPRRVLRVAPRAAIDHCPRRRPPRWSASRSSVRAAGGPSRPPATIGAGGEYHALTPARILDTRDPALDVAPAGRKPFATAGWRRHVQRADRRQGRPARRSSTTTATAPTTTCSPSPSTSPSSTRRDRLPRGVRQGRDAERRRSLDQLQARRGRRQHGDPASRLRRRALDPPGTGAVARIGRRRWSTCSAGSRRAPTSTRVAPGSSRPVPAASSTPARAPYGAAPFAGGAAAPDRRSAAPRRSTPARRRRAQRSQRRRRAASTSPASTTIPAASRRTSRCCPRRWPPGDCPRPATSTCAPARSARTWRSCRSSADGSVWVYNNAGNTHVVLDVMGYFVPARRRHARVAAWSRSCRRSAPSTPASRRSHDQPLPPGQRRGLELRRLRRRREGRRRRRSAPSSGVIGNLTAAGARRQYSWAPVGVVRHRLPHAGRRRRADAAVDLEPRHGRGRGRAQHGDARLRRATPQVRFYNRAGYLDYLLDVTAVVLA